jgi:hypothetical protein
LDEERIATGDLIIAELMQGFRTKSQFATATQIINRLEYYDLCGRENDFWVLSEKNCFIATQRV